MHNASQRAATSHPELRPRNFARLLIRVHPILLVNSQLGVEQPVVPQVPDTSISRCLVDVHYFDFSHPPPRPLDDGHPHPTSVLAAAHGSCTCPCPLLQPARLQCLFEAPANPAWREVTVTERVYLPAPTLMPGEEHRTDRPASATGIRLE